MNSPPRRFGGRLVPTLTVGILLGLGFVYVVLTVDITIPQSALTFFQLNQQRLESDEAVAYGAPPSNTVGGNDTTSSINLTSGPDKYLHGRAPDLAKNVRILCWIMTGPVSHKRKAIHVKQTWGKRCDKLLFMSSRKEPLLPTIVLPRVKEGRNYLWAKTKEAFKYVFENHINDAEWFMKADDDTFVVVENLRLLLNDYDTKDPLYFGCILKHRKEPFMSGGTGYVLSKEALRRFVVDAIPNRKKCAQGHDGPEDVEIGNCLHNVGVEGRDTRGRFGLLPDPLVQKPGVAGCSETAVAFHHASPTQMYVYEYLLPAANKSY